MTKTAQQYVKQFYPLWFTCYQSQYATQNRLVGPVRISPLHQIVVAIDVDTLYACTFVNIARQPLILTIPSATVDLLDSDPVRTPARAIEGSSSEASLGRSERASGAAALHRGGQRKTGKMEVAVGARTATLPGSLPRSARGRLSTSTLSAHPSCRPGRFGVPAETSLSRHWRFLP